MNDHSTNHSADVRLHLLIDGKALELSRISPHGCTLRRPAEFPPCEAEVIMHVDGHARIWRVYLPDGVSQSSREVKYTTGRAGIICQM